ncbi:hypothetical protein E2562_022015 [Oryza meyeriana var. granulata]|uniref:Mitotic-spindle organizing protein 1 n=1 Tax=Oryza meyeriana var. granulata TaxID=110450 RepID=A0A6G1ENI0_9ORYZ|nr:hypothetical protein E2562_022015 [Oryza meyeriana var. granulata]
MSQILDTGLDRHTLSLLMALCDRGANPEALAALVRVLSSSAPPIAAAASSPLSNSTAAPSPKASSLVPFYSVNSLGVATLYLAATFSVNVYRGLSWHSEQSKLEEKCED